MLIVGQIKWSWLIPHEQAICFSSLIWLSRNKSVKKSRFSRMVKNSREFSLLDLDLEAFWFHFSLLEKEWKHFDFTLHFSKKSESIFFSLCTSRKRVKAFLFHFSLLELQKPTLAGPWCWEGRKYQFWLNTVQRPNLNHWTGVSVNSAVAPSNAVEGDNKNSTR